MPSTTPCPCKRCSSFLPEHRLSKPALIQRHLRRYGHADQERPGVPAASNRSQGSAVNAGSAGRSQHHLQEALDPVGDHLHEHEHSPAPASPVEVNAQVPPVPLHEHAAAQDTEWTKQRMPNNGIRLEDDIDIDLEDDLSPNLTPPAYAKEEPSYVRMAYLQAVINNALNNLSVRDTNSNLQASINMLREANALPEWPPPATTLETAKRRLGLDPDVWIIQYAICPVCWKHFAPSEMEALQGPSCPVDGCSGEIYTTHTTAKGETKRNAIKIIPQVSLIETIRRMVRRKGFRKQLRDSRNVPRNQADNPDFVMKDVHDGKMWHDLYTNLERETGNLGTVRDEVVGEGEEKTRLSDNRSGLHMVINLDWFSAFDNRPHSSGPIYISFADLPREQRYLQINTICIAITPGPKEPTTEQLNHCMEPFVRDTIQLQKGVEMEMYADDDITIIKEAVHADFLHNNCDTPAARKISGFAGHSSDNNPCPWCHCLLVDVNLPKGYDINRFQLRNDYELLKQKYQHRDAHRQRREEINTVHGVHWSVFDWIPGWRPSRQTPLDFMHCVFLGIVKSFFMVALVNAHMFSNEGGRNSSNSKYEAAINSIRWPSHITRLPKNLGSAKGLAKADEWRRLLTIAPVVIWCAWKDADDNIPDAEPPLASNAKLGKINSSRNQKSLYDAMLLLCAAVRILSTRSISVSQALEGQLCLSRYCQRLLELKVVLTINHHLSMHFATMIQLFGPVYGWWLFAFERFNGRLENVNTNGHDGGRVELTMLRNWVQNHLLYELLLQLPDSASEAERALINTLIEGDAKRGGMAVEIAMFMSEASVDNVTLPNRISASTFNAHTVDGLYGELLKYAQTRWPALYLTYEISDQPGLPFIGDQVVRRLPYIRKDGLRYGCASNARSKTDCFAFIKDGHQRVPVQIEDLFLLKIPGTEEPAHVCARIRRLLPPQQAIDVPWQLYATLLGIHTMLADQFGEYEIVPASDIDSPLALIPVSLSHTREDLWIAVSFDRTSQEPEEYVLFEGDGE